MISPDYFKNQILETFGSISYVLELCGAYFGAFLFIKFVIDITVLVFRYFELRHLTGNTLSFTKTLLSASYNLFFTSVLTSVFTPRAPLEDSIEERTKTEDEIKTVNWPPISKPDDLEEQETLEGIERLSKWISELETSTMSSCQNEKLLETPVLWNSFPLTETIQPKTKFNGKVKQLYNSAEEAKTRCLQLETTISNLQAIIKYQCSLLRKTNIIDGRNNEPFLWQIPAFSMLYRKAKTFPNEPLSNFICSFTSPIYTTHLAGCKISLRLFPYGINLFRGTHSSICCELHLCDFTLPRTWPFDRQLEISIIDQKDKNNKWSTYFPNYSQTTPAPTHFLTSCEKISSLTRSYWSTSGKPF